jgi:hypothetical protein
MELDFQQNSPEDVLPGLKNYFIYIYIFIVRLMCSFNFHDNHIVVS